MAKSASAPSNTAPELLAEAIREVSKLQRAAREASGKIAPCFEKYKAMGVNRRALKRALKDRDRDDDEVLAENREYIRMMAIEKHKVSADDLFAELDLTPLGAKAAQEHLLAAAEEQGYAAGKRGADDDSAKRYPPGTPAQVAWARGHRRGAEVRAETQPEGVEVASADKKRPGRPKADLGAGSAPPPAMQADKPAAQPDALFGEIENSEPEDSSDPDGEAPATPPLTARAKAGKPAKVAPVSDVPKRRGRPPGKGKVAAAMRH